MSCHLAGKNQETTVGSWWRKEDWNVGTSPNTRPTCNVKDMTPRKKRRWQQGTCSFLLKADLWLNVELSFLSCPSSYIIASCFFVNIFILYASRFCYLVPYLGNGGIALLYAQPPKIHITQPKRLQGCRGQTLRTSPDTRATRNVNDMVPDRPMLEIWCHAIWLARTRKRQLAPGEERKTEILGQHVMWKMK